VKVLIKKKYIRVVNFVPEINLHIYKAWNWFTCLN
jgi:hypothetical protein